LKTRPTLAGLDHSQRNADHVKSAAPISSSSKMKARNTLVSAM